MLGNLFFSALRLNARLKELMLEPEGIPSVLAGLRHDALRQERLKLTIGKITGPTVTFHLWLNKLIACPSPSYYTTTNMDHIACLLHKLLNLQL